MYIYILWQLAIYDSMLLYIHMIPQEIWGAKGPWECFFKVSATARSRNEWATVGITKSFLVGNSGSTDATLLATLPNKRSMVFGRLIRGEILQPEMLRRDSHDVWFCDVWSCLIILWREHRRFGVQQKPEVLPITQKAFRIQLFVDAWRIGTWKGLYSHLDTSYI